MKHDPYKNIPIPDGTHIEPCPVCGADGALWRRSDAFNEPMDHAVECTNGDAIGPQNGLMNEGCFLYFGPVEQFYHGRIADAVKYWNEFAKALNAQRRKRNWDRVGGLSGVLRKQDV